MGKIYIVQELGLRRSDHFSQEAAAADGRGANVRAIIDDNLAGLAENVLDAILAGREAAVGNLDARAAGVSAVHRADEMFHQLVRILKARNRPKQLENAGDALIVVD